MCHFLFSLSKSVVVICIKKNQRHHKGAAECISADNVECVFVLCSTYSVCLVTCEWTNGRDSLMQIHLFHRECLRKLACAVRVCITQAEQICCIWDVSSLLCECMCVVCEGERGCSLSAWVGLSVGISQQGSDRRSRSLAETERERENGEGTGEERELREGRSPLRL